MNICITPESIKLFSAYFKKEIPNHFTNEISANALLNKLFDKAISDFKNTGLTEERTRELVLQHLTVAPQIIKKHIGENPSANNPKLLESLNQLSGKIYDASQSDNKNDFQNAINSLGQIIGKSTLVIPAATVGNDFNALSFELLKTANQEMIYEEGVGYRNNITDPLKQFEFEVIRAIINSGNPNNLQLKLVKQSELKGINQISNTNTDTNPDAYVLVPVDSSGKIVRFVDEKVNEDGTTPVFVFRQTAKEFDYFVKEKSDIYIASGMSPQQAFAKVRQEIQGHLEFIANLKKDHAAGKTVNFSISLANSLMGLVVEKLDRKTSMRSITNIDEVPIHIKRKGTQTVAVMHVPLSGRQVLPNEKPLYENSMMNVTDEELDILTKLITNPKLKKTGIRRKTGESYTSDMRFEERQAAIYYFHRNATDFNFSQKKEFDNLTKKTNQLYFIRIKNEVIEATAENAEQIKQALKTYFTTLSSELYTYSTDFTNVTPKESFAKTTDVGQVFYGEDGRVYITTGPKRNLNILNETDVESMINVPTAVIDGVVTLESKSIRNHIIDNTKTTIITNGNNELRGYSSYLALGYTAEDASEAMIDDSVEPLFRTLAETNLETEPTEKQKEDAMTWFKNHPLFKVLSLNETLRNKIHEKGPSFVAEFVNSSINLYLGSNNTDIYHEAFHAFTQSILTAQERKAMYSEIAKTPGSFKVTVLGKAKTVKFAEANELEIEEYLAEKFREYSMNRGKSKLSVRIKQFFDKVLNMLQGMFGKNMTFNEAIALNKSAGVVNAMFNALYEGNIDISKFNPQATKTALYKSSEINVKNNADVILPIGTSGSGKSTWVKSINSDNEFEVISPDAMRVEFTGDMNDKSKDEEIYKEAASRTIQAIKNGKKVIFDTTNLTKEKRRPFIKAIKEAIPGANIQYKLMPLDAELAKQRIKADIEAGVNRANVSEETIDRHAKLYKQMLKDITSEDISVYEDMDFSIEQVSVLMESMQSLMSDFINLGINGSSNRKVNTLVVNLLLESSQVKVDSKRHKKIFEEIEKLNKNNGVVNGYGAFAIAKNPKILELALTYIKNRLEQQKKLMKPLSKDDDGFALNTLNKALLAFGDVTEPKLYLDETENSNLISLYLNNYSNINVEQETLDYFDSLDDVERGIKYSFGLTGTEQSLAEVTDEQTKEMLSTIHAHANNGKGAVMVNSLGIKKVQPFIQMLAKTSKILRNTTDRVEMYNKLVAAAKTDYEIAQIVTKLGNINNPEITTEEQKAWLNFWQVMNKTDLFLREFIIEKVVDTDRKTKEKTATLEARSGRSKSAESRVGKDWVDNFVFVSHNSPYFSETKEGEAYLKFDDKSQKYDLVEDYEEKGYGLISGTEDSPEFITSLDERINKTDNYTGKLFKASANPFEFLSQIGIDLVQDPVVLDILLNGHVGLDIQTGIVDNILKSLMNRQTAVNENNKKVTELSQLFSDFDYINANGEKVKQEGLNGWFNQLQKLQYMFSDENSSSMSKNAEGENQSEKSYNSSLSMMVTALNDAKHYDEILAGSGLEMFNVKTNPFAAASPWLINLFNLESPNAATRGTRNKNFKITVESLSGSKIIFQSEDKGVSTLGLDEKAKFLSDFHLTLEGKQEILRTADKSTSLTAHAPVNKNGRIIKNELEVTKEDVNKIFSPEYDANKNSTILYDQFFRHLEAELVRISRMNDITEDLESEGEVVFDAAYLKRGQDFYMFANILTPETKKELLKLKISDSQAADINNSRVLNKLISPEFKKVIDKELKAYFENRSDGLFNRKNKSLVIAGTALKAFQKNSEEEVDVTRKRMFRAFTINNFIQNANFATLFIGDAAIHDVRGEGYHKRIAGLISTGKIFANDTAFLAHVNNPNFNAFGFAEKHNNATTGRAYDGYINSAVIKEKKSVSAYLQQYSELINAKDYGAKNKMKEADGAGWISFDMYRILNLACGEWNDAQEALYNKMLAGEKISEEDAKTTFPVRKFQYFGQVNNKDAAYNLQMMAFHKYSLMPLIPALIEGTPLQDLHESMLKQGVDYVTMESGSKLSSISKVEMENGEVVSKFDDFYDDERKTNDIEFTVNQIHSKYLKNQIYLAPGYKNHITLPTQKRKMIALGLFNDEQIPTDFKPNLSKDERKTKWESLKTDSKKRAASKNYDWYKRYEVVISKIQAHLKNELIDDLGLSYGADGLLTGSPKKLVAYLEKQMKSNDMLADDINYIVSVSENAETLDFSLSMYSEKIEAILMTLADKKLRALNVNGEALVQVPGTMFENKKRAEEFAKIEKPTLKDIHEYGSNGLSFYHVTDKNGDPVLTKDTNSWIVKSMEVKISLQGDFKKLLYLKHPDGEKIAVYNKNAEGKNILDYDASLARLNESIKNKEWKAKYSKFLEIAGDRIPSQGPNALESITIAEFLPEWAGPIIILPAEIVAKAGSDYDIDKLFTQFPNIVKIGNKIELQQYRSDVTESLEELYAEKKDIVDELKDTRDEIDDLYKQRTNFFEASDDITNDVKKQIQDQYELDNDLFTTRNELTGYIKAAENGLWRFKNISAKKRNEYVSQYQEQLDAVNELIEFQEEQLKKILFEELGVEKASDFFKYSDNLIKAQKQKQTELQDKLEEVQRKIYGKSIKGLENELLSLFAEKILMPSSIKDLITTNSTDVALPIAQRLEEIIRERDSESRFNKYDRVTDENGDGISPTTLFDYEYNLLKHQENSVGKDSLAIAAVTATYYAMFQTFGAKLNAVSQKEQNAFDEAITIVSKAADINYQVEQIKEDNKDNITPEVQKQIASLLKLLPRADKIEKANSTVSKFKNYTFKLNHNKLKSELGEHVALGIINNTKDQSISDLLSQMINGYVDVAKDAWIFNMQGNKQNTPTLLFMIMAGVSLESAAYLSSTSLVMEYNQIKKELSGVYANLGLDPEMSPIVEMSKINKKAQEMLFENHRAEFNANGLDSFNYNSIANKNSSEFTESELLDLVKEKAIDMRQIQALAEYVHIEKIASDVSKFQQLTRFDTNKLATISEAQKRKEDILEFISRKTYVPQSWFSAEGIGNTPVGQFNNDEFLVNLFERYFSLRDNPALVKTSLDKVIKDNKPKTVVDVVMRTDFKNDFIWFLYQNSLFKKNTYDGYTIKVLNDPKAEFSINEETKVVTVSNTVLGNDIISPKSGLTSYLMHNFPTVDQYIRFKIEFAKLENIDPVQLRKDYYFLDNARNKVTDLWLKTKIALYKSRNQIAYFYGPTSVGNMFKRFKQEHPDLAKKYAIIRDMKFSNDKKTYKSNMYLPDISDVNLRKQYKENLAELKNDPRPEIKEFFSLFNHIAMMQTGVNRRSQYDLGKIIDADHLHNVIDNGIGIGKIINELNQINDNIEEARLNNLNKNNTPMIPDLQLLDQFKELFIGMMESSYKTRVRGYNYEVQNLNFGKHKVLTETISSFNNVVVLNSLVGAPKDRLALTASLFYDEDGEYTPEEFAESIKDEKIAILNKKLIAPVGEDQAVLDKLLLDYLGINNSGNFPILEYKSKTVKEGFLSIAGLGLKLMPIHSVKDEAMANASTVAIGQATIVNPNANSSSQNYVDELTAKYPGKLADSKTKFKSTDSVWVFGSGVFASRIKNVTAEEFDIALNKTFDTYHKPAINKAIKAGVKTFNVGTASGIDKMALDYLESQGYIKVPVYAPIGKYYEMRKSNSTFEDLNYDINSTIVTSNSLEAGDLISFLFNEDKANNWYTNLSETQKFAEGVATVYDKIVNQLNRNTMYKIQFGNRLVTQKGQIKIGDSPLSAAIEQALYKMRNDIINHRQTKSVKAPVVNQPLSFDMEIGSFVKYQGSTYIITQFNDNGTVQIYNPTLEGDSAKIPVLKENIETLSSKAKIVNHEEEDYIVTPKGTIISLTTNKAMNWAENDGKRIAILEKSKASVNKTFNTSVIPLNESQRFTRESAEKDSEYMYLFTDNAGRTSGSGVINPNTWYAKKYGKDSRYASKTQAVARGLENVYPITTMVDDNRTQWTDADFDTYKKIIDDEISTIQQAAKNYKGIKFGGEMPFGKGAISNMKDSAPKIWNYLNSKLAEIGIDNTGDIPVSTQPSATKANITSIPQNRVSGVESMGSTQQAAANVKQVLGISPHSIDMIDADFRTRTTRSVGEMEKYKVKVGDLVIQSGKSSNGLIKNIFTRITAIHPKGTAGYLGTWNKEGWSQEGITEIERYKNGAAAIEFEVIRYTGTIPMKEFLSLPLTRQTVIIEQQLKC